MGKFIRFMISLQSNVLRGQLNCIVLHVNGMIARCNQLLTSFPNRRMLPRVTSEVVRE